MLNILVVTVFSTALAENTLRVSNQTFVSSTSSLGGYLEARLTDPNNNRQLTPWKPVCGGSQWTNKEALVACNQLRYHNTTTIAITSGQCSSYPYEINDDVDISGCNGVMTTLEDCITTLSTCNNWGGIICSSLEMCSQEVCSNSSRCQLFSTCYNCTTPPELNCICYSECSPPCLNGDSASQCPPGWTGPNCNQSVTSTLVQTSLDQTNTVTSTTYSTSMLNSDMSPASILEHINKINSMPTPSSDFSFIPTLPPHPSSPTEELIYPATPAAPTLVSETYQPSCLNRGTCSFVKNTRSCQCPPNYSGPRCEREEGAGVPQLYIAIVVVVVMLALILLLIVAVLIILLRKNKKMKRHSRDDADDHLAMQGRIYENTRYVQQGAAGLEDTYNLFRKDSGIQYEAEYQNIVRTRREKTSPSIEIATSINNKAGQASQSMNKDFMEPSYAVPDKKLKGKDVTLAPCDSMEVVPMANVTVNTCEYSEISTVEKSRQANAAESNAVNQDSDNFYYELEDTPMTIKLPLTKYTGHTDEYTEIPTTNECIAAKRSIAGKDGLTSKPLNLSSTNGGYSITRVDNYEANSTKSNGSDCKPVNSIYDQVEWDYETIDDTVAEKALFASNRGFCQPKQTSTSNFRKPLKEGLQNSAVSQEEINGDVYM